MNKEILTVEKYRCKFPTYQDLLSYTRQRREDDNVGEISHYIKNPSEIIF